MYSPELQSKLAVWQQKTIEGTISIEEFTEAIRLMRGERTAALQASRAGTKRLAKAKAEIRHADDMLDELDNI